MKSCGNTYKKWCALPATMALCAVLVGSCAVPFRDDGRQGYPGPEAGGVERTDPLADPGDAVIATETDIGLPDYSQPLSDTALGRPRSGVPVGADTLGSGYDVQFYATLNIVEARRVQRQADTLTAMPVRIAFEEPYYKVFAGPYRSFEEAEAFLRLITRLEYPSAWIVVHRTNKGE